MFRVRSRESTPSHYQDSSAIGTDALKTLLTKGRHTQKIGGFFNGRTTKRGGGKSRVDPPKPLSGKTLIFFVCVFPKLSNNMDCHLFLLYPAKVAQYIKQNSYFF